MRKESTYHSRSPHFMKFQMLATRLIWPRSTANTPIWQVTDDNTSTVVLVEPSGMFR